MATLREVFRHGRGEPLSGSFTLITALTTGNVVVSPNDCRIKRDNILGVLYFWKASWVIPIVSYLTMKLRKTSWRACQQLHYWFSTGLSGQSSLCLRPSHTRSGRAIRGCLIQRDLALFGKVANADGHCVAAPPIKCWRLLITGVVVFWKRHSV